MCMWSGPLSSVMRGAARVEPSTEQSAVVRVSVPSLTTPNTRPSWECQPVLPPGAMVISRVM